MTGLQARFRWLKPYAAVLKWFVALGLLGYLVYEHIYGNWENLDKIADGQHAFLMRAFQEVERYRGVHPSQAHLDLAPIRKGQFDRRLVIPRDVLRDEGVDQDDAEAWVKVEEGMRRLIQRDSP